MLFTNFCLSVMYFLIAFRNNEVGLLECSFQLLFYSLCLNLYNESYNFGSLPNLISSKVTGLPTPINHSQLLQKATGWESSPWFLTVLYFSYVACREFPCCNFGERSNFPGEQTWLKCGMFVRIQMKSSLDLLQWFQLIIPVFRSAPSF